MDGSLGAETLFNSLVTPNRGNVTIWLNLWALMEGWLMAVDHVGRCIGSWSYILGSTPNHENEWKTNNLGWMLYLGYDVLGVCCSLGVCCTRCQLIIMAWRNRQGWLDILFCDDSWFMDETERDTGWGWEWCGGYERTWQIRGSICVIGLGSPPIGVITRRIGTRICHIRDSELTCTRNSLKSQFLMMIFPHLFSSLSFSSSTVPSPKNTKLSHPSLSLHAIIKSSPQVQHPPSTSIHRV